MPPHQSFLGGRAVLATVAPKASGTPTGTVTFRSGSKILGMSPLNGGHGEVLDRSTGGRPSLHHAERQRQI